MAKPPVLTNSNLSGPRGAYTVFKEVDFERISNSGLQTMLILYMASRGEVFAPTLRLMGTPMLTSSSDSPVFPTALYLDPSGKLMGFPGYLLFNRTQPEKVEIMAEASKPEDYLALKKVVDDWIPKLFRAGYDQTNSGHTSVAWLHLGKELRPRGKLVDSILGVDSLGGFKVYETEVDGIKVFTERDLERFRDLKMSK